MNNLKQFHSFILILLSLFILTSCSGTIPSLPNPSESIPDAYTIQNAPYVLPTMPGGCGNVTAEMVFKYYGRDDLTQEYLADVCGVPLGDICLREVARDEGFNCEICFATRQELKGMIAKDVPIYAKIKSNNVGATHCIELVGYKDLNEEGSMGEIIYHNAGVGSYLTMTYAKYEEINVTEDPNRYFALIICPKDVSIDVVEIYKNNAF